MKTETENPQVYPLIVHESDRFGLPCVVTYEGITLRDHFAGLAMSNLVEWASAKELSKKAYEIADAMLEERLKINK